MLIGKYLIRSLSIIPTPRGARSVGPAMRCAQRFCEYLATHPWAPVKTLGDSVLLPATKEEDQTILFHSASHHRQRLQVSECRGVEILRTSGDAVIAKVIDPKYLLVFRHRDFAERVFPNKDEVIVRVVQEEACL